jgi:uncharacterized protein DUF4157
MPAADAARWSQEQAARWEALADELRRRLGPGTPLPAPERARFESRLGADLGRAALHPTPLAGRLARGQGAEALTVGSHVLGAGADLDAQTPRGAALLGHELTHAVRAPASLPVQRETAAAATSAEETVAQRVEASLLASPPSAAPEAPAGGGGGGVDAEALADRVYRRLMDQVLLEHERAAWMS